MQYDCLGPDHVSIFRNREVALIQRSSKAGQLNSQFIVTKFSILHAGRRSLFRFQTNRETRMAMLELEIVWALPLIRALKGVGSKVLYI